MTYHLWVSVPRKLQPNAGHTECGIEWPGGRGLIVAARGVRPRYGRWCRKCRPDLAKRDAR